MTEHDDDPDPKALSRFVGAAARPWVGWGFVAVGILLVLLGYLGVSGESVVAKQVPYLVSGGIGGVVLCVVGAYFLGTEELRSDSGRLDRLEAMVAELHAALLERADAPRPASASASSHDGDASTVVAVARGTTFHRPRCLMAVGKDVEELSPAVAVERHLAPCKVCEPTA